MFDSWVELSSDVDSETIVGTLNIPSTCLSDPATISEVQPSILVENPTKETSNEAALEAIIHDLTIEKVYAFIGNQIYMERGAELKAQVYNLEVNTQNDNNTQMSARIPIENSAASITSTVFFAKTKTNQEKEDTLQLMKAKCSCPIGNWGNCKHCAAVLLYALDKKPNNPSNDNEPLLLAKRSYDEASEENNATSSSNESRKKANSSVESYDSVRKRTILANDSYCID